jgi:aminoglycoside phosphotransferase (APT) family kinase protein
MPLTEPTDPQEHPLLPLLRFVNDRHGTAFVPRGRYAAGEQGAFAIADGSDEGAARFVLKWRPGGDVPDNLRQAVAVTDRLRAVGYPAPRYRLVGVAPSLGLTYSVQEALPGVPVTARLHGAVLPRLDGALLDRLLELNALQRGQAVAPAGDWPRTVVDTLRHGGEGFCLHEPLRTYSRQTAALLGALRRVAAEVGDGRAAADDVVHFDFQGSNILLDRGGVSGVVDWEGCGAGDRAFDLATLFFYTGEGEGGEGGEPDERERLWRLLLTRAEPRLLRLYLAHLVLRQVDWSIRFHDRAAVDRWLGRSEEVLRRLSSLAEGDR